MSIVGHESAILWKPEYLANVFEIDWKNSQLVQAVKDLGLNAFECSVSGGAMVRTMMKTDIFKGDIDIFPHSKSGLDDLIATFSVNKTWKRTRHAYEFEYVSGIRKTKAQIIMRDATPKPLDATLQTFDFEHCKMGYYPRTDTLIASVAAPIMLSKMKVRLAHVRDPKYSLGRAIKYKKMGFDCDDAIEQLVAMQIKGLKDHNFDNFTPAEVWETIVKAASSS